MEHQTQIDVTRLTRRHSLAAVSNQSSIILVLCRYDYYYGKNGQKLEGRAKNGRNSSTAGHGANYEKFKWESGSRLARLAILLGVDTATSHWFVSTWVFCTSGGYWEFWQWRKKTELIKNWPWSQESIWFEGQIGQPLNVDVDWKPDEERKNYTLSFYHPCHHTLLNILWGWKMFHTQTSDLSRKRTSIMYEISNKFNLKKLLNLGI